MLKKYNEDDFYEIESVSSGRLRPDNLSGFFWSTFIISGVMTAIFIFGAGKSIQASTQPIWQTLVNISKIFLAIQLIVALFFSFQKNCYKFQRVQSIFLSIFSIKLSLDMYPIFFLSSVDRSAPSYMIHAAVYLLIGGLIYLIYSTIRAINKLAKGKFRKDGEGLNNFAKSKGHVSLPIVFGVTMISGTIVRTISDSSVYFAPFLELFFFLFIAVALQYTIAFAWPEFFLFTYCKFRFESFIIPMPRRPLEDKYTAKRRKPQKKQTAPVNSHNNHKKKQKRKKARG
ncbi:hypothetical protein [Bacillus marasmi]|uniref:hypothetical protein n=1 Tax=Bacillus marasmi TaxID=1926279 RepID=UPI0011CAE9F7|nr:hypothetical protein [Bacillus marasmi]